ncbi:hypothetical protein SY83_22070 [Paenibacillus swuensis]|uniref:Transcriptional regulator LacI/GalR-like sensor domain-containing protein n=1 Tax=Paenibacillus swuensis TaxID=1178515 RepID=A0A172TP46_9BACL|nr:LacI family DNA-binding transcriptional regulator [Paenibacillus swuensis]ANE48523.1 hypothetical protein SY83_22070 [Paenibacillus swuensis]
MMNKMLPLIAEPAYTLTSWYTKTVAGIESEAGRRGLKLTVYPTELNDVMEEIPNPGAILVLGSSAAWEQTVLNQLHAAGVHPILVSTHFHEMQSSSSYIALDHSRAACELTRSVIDSGCKRLAFCGMNPDSLTDLLKHRGYVTAHSQANILVHDEDIYRMDGSISRCFEKLLPMLPQYDAVICTNDVVAVLLIQTLKEISPNLLSRLSITGFGDTMTGRITTPSLTTVTLDYAEAGRKAVDLLLYLVKHDKVVSSSITVASHIQTRETTSGFHDMPVDEGSHLTLSKSSNAVSARTEQQFYRMEHLLQESDSLDLDILRALLTGNTYESLSEHINLSVTAIKYRIKKMLIRSESTSKAELLKLISTYVEQSDNLKNLYGCSG